MEFKILCGDILCISRIGGQTMPYFIFEGPDGVGKSTAINNTIATLGKNFPLYGKIVSTQLPGTTPLGQHIRKLVKDPQAVNQDININPLTRQILYAADYSSFIIDHLSPLLGDGTTVVCDRCSAISSRVYGHAEGVNIDDLDALYKLIKSPIADVLFVLNCDPEQAQKRIEGNREKDHFDFKPLEFKKKVHESYLKLCEVGHPLHTNSLHLAKRIVSIDASKTESEVLEQIIKSI